ncbi:hypothetical protein G6F46_015002 [Rhizopus delemar]|uniref:Uncharacterized protein n=1 Tax=Rhizopus oryzae TaxID=64495 RepID=A0A9P6WQZ1_RHIOR|nr:hypothetical protein G6F24_018900 [Rhizopus arrhizus]KAG1167606.1 hypothetical protein G6F35_017679 [Rhizopus arrhizus]KAG1271754.1 hypothetical protein G6F64_015576 [Rhizopus arrhizus]KAG1584223.1 hypothetical protein G6F46_015002 [Rhizopus delemar]
MSASRSSRFCTRLVAASSSLSPGCSRRSRASAGGRTSMPMTSLAEIRTVPDTPVPCPAAARSSAAAVLRMASA